MNKYLLLAMTNPIPGRDEAFNDWYDNVAYPTYKSMPGLVPLGRFKAVDVPKMFPFQLDGMFEYLSLYYFEADDPADFLDSIKAKFPERPEYQFSEDIDKSRFFEPIYVAMGDVNFAPLDLYEDLKR